MNTKKQNSNDLEENNKKNESEEIDIGGGWDSSNLTGFELSDFKGFELSDFKNDIASLDEMIKEISDFELPEFDLEPLGFDFEPEPLPEPDPNLKPSDVANWMVEDLREHEILYHNKAVHYIRRYFGERFTYTNRLGNPAISEEVLKEFLLLTQETVVWSRKHRLWRYRKPGDPPNSRMIDM